MLTLLGKNGRVLFMFILFFAGVEVKKQLFGKSSSLLQLVFIEYELVHGKIGFKLSVLCE